MSLVLPVTNVKLPVVMAEALVPVVVSKTRLLAVPLTFAATEIAPLWLIRLFEANKRPEPLARLMAPEVTMPEEPPAAVLFAVTERLEPVPVNVSAPSVALVVLAVPLATTVRPVLAVMRPLRLTKSAAQAWKAHITKKS